MKRIALLVLLSLVSACGGGGGGGASTASGAPFFGGVWDGTVVLERDECGIAADRTIDSFTHTVNQVDDTMALEVSGGGHFRGSVDDELDGFVVVGDKDTFSVGRGTCEVFPGIIYDEVKEDKAFVFQAVLMKCYENGVLVFECATDWVGTASCR